MSMNMSSGKGSRSISGNHSKTMLPGVDPADPRSLATKTSGRLSGLLGSNQSLFSYPSSTRMHPDDDSPRRSFNKEDSRKTGMRSVQVPSPTSSNMFTTMNNRRRPTIASHSVKPTKGISFAGDKKSMPKGGLSRSTSKLVDHDDKEHRVDAWANDGLARQGCLCFQPIHPDSPFRMLWDMGIFFLIIYTTLATPLRVAFFPVASYTESMVLWLWLDFGVDMMFVLDTCFNFFTGFPSADIADYIILDLKQIRYRYLRGWFFVDFVSSLPIDAAVFLMTSNLDNGTDHESILGLIRLVKLLKLLRLIKLRMMLEDWEEKFFSASFNPGVRRLISILFWVLILSHLNACGWYAVGLSSANSPEGSWIEKYASDYAADGSTPDLYIMAAYWSVVTLTSVGYGDISAVNNSERGYAILAAFVGSSVFGYIIGHMSSIVANLNQSSSIFHQRMDAINSYLRCRNVPLELQFKIRRYYKYFLKRKSAFDEETILDELSHPLRVELSMFLIEDIFSNMELFCDVTDPAFLAKIVTLLKPLSAIPGDMIITEGEVGSEMFLLVRGSVEVISGDGALVYAQLGPGTHFGEMAPLEAKAERRTASVRALEHCDMFTLSKQSLGQVIDDFPEVEEHLTKIAAERLTICKNLRTQIKLQRLAAKQHHVTDIKDNISTKGKNLLRSITRQSISKTSTSSLGISNITLGRPSTAPTAQSMAARHDPTNDFIMHDYLAPSIKSNKVLPAEHVLPAFTEGEEDEEEEEPIHRNIFERRRSTEGRRDSKTFSERGQSVLLDEDPESVLKLAQLNHNIVQNTTVYAMSLGFAEEPDENGSSSIGRPIPKVRRSVTEANLLGTAAQDTLAPQESKVSAHLIAMSAKMEHKLEAHESTTDDPKERKKSLEVSAQAARKSLAVATEQVKHTKRLSSMVENLHAKQSEEIIFLRVSVDELRQQSQLQSQNLDRLTVLVTQLVARDSEQGSTKGGLGSESTNDSPSESGRKC